ncbi:MAG: hypothetical protein CME65_03920 [Halobacteriovoraceae bacterium]|nr:hypothetical protein [Halobacteriovoraceae bacterium]|tara:strand:+ start:16592 stop:17098 length:507 start_codon:yes stop_codon:yes gene_type:complete
MLLDRDAVIGFLPHRPPFLFIDSVKEITPSQAVIDEPTNTDTRKLVGTKVVCEFTVRDDLEILKGHFPGNPILPGVVQIEMMAQCSAFTPLAMKSLDLSKTKVETLLISCDKSKFRQPIYPGMKLEIHAVMEKCRGTLASYNCEVFHAGKKVSEVSFMAKLDIVQKEA